MLRRQLFARVVGEGAKEEATGKERQERSGFEKDSTFPCAILSSISTSRSEPVSDVSSVTVGAGPERQGRASERVPAPPLCMPLRPAGGMGVPTLPRGRLLVIRGHRVLTRGPVKPQCDTGWSHFTKLGTNPGSVLHWLSVVVDKNHRPVTHLIFMGRPRALRCPVKYVLENLEPETNISGEIQQNEMGGDREKNRRDFW